MWKDLHELAEMNGAEEAVAEEACRIKDRLDQLDVILTDPEASWLRFRMNDEATEVTVSIDSVLSESRQQANVFKQLIAALRLPDDKSGERPQHRGGGRGAYKSAGNAGAGAKVTSIERARRARAG